MDSISNSIWQDFFGVTNETAFQTIIPVVITVLIFVLGFMLEAFRSWNKKRRDNNKKREFVFSQVKVLIEAVSDQKIAVESYLDILRQDKNITHIFELKVTFHPKHINQIGANKLFELFVLGFSNHRNQHLEYFNSLIKQLDLIEALKVQFTNSFNYTLEYLNKYLDKWNLNIKDIRDLHDNWKINLLRDGINPNDDDYLYNFNQLYLRWVSTQGYSDLYVAESNFLNEALQQARIYSINRYAQTMLQPLLECKDAVDSHRNLRKIKISEYEKYAEQLIEIEKNLKEFLEFYEKGKQ